MIIFEAFETSPPSDKVLAAGNALRWEFPGRSAELSMSYFRNADFQRGLANFLDQASAESLAQFTAIATKCAKEVKEVRDTTDPALITVGLMSLLEAVGSPVTVPLLQKRVRDDVNIGDADIPWRRLPVWLLLRVAIQRQLFLLQGGEDGRAYYKCLMVTFLAELLKDCTGFLNPTSTFRLNSKLCRRIGKLHIGHTTASSVYKSFFDCFGEPLYLIIQAHKTKAESDWNSFKQQTIRRIPKLPHRATTDEFQLELKQSKHYLLRILQISRSGPSVPSLASNSPQLDSAIQQVSSFVEEYFKLASLEAELKTENWAANSY
jgi:hypothetical protein